MLDTHCHLNLEPLVDDWQSHLQQAISQDITTFIIPSVDLPSSQTAIDIATESDHCYAAIGIHPHEAASPSHQDLQKIKHDLIFFAKNKKVVAIGETGLDYFRLDEENKHQNIQSQHQLFSLHLKLAQTLNLPTIIHVRDNPDQATAHQDALNLIKQTPTQAILHCFSGDQEYLRQALDLNLYISFAGNLTFKNAQDLQHLITQVPLNRLLLETDAPYLNPNRGQWPNTPSNITQTYQFTAQLLNLSVKELSHQIHQNTKTLFGI